MPRKHAFTLIELLIVVAIIAILAAIAVPNFLEAQVRAKVSRAKADMRSIATAIEAYRIDANKTPPPFEGFTYHTGSEWWGFVPQSLTTPIAYLTSIPSMPFTDTVVTGYWTGFTGGKGTQNNQPYTYIGDPLFLLNYGGGVFLKNDPLQNNSGNPKLPKRYYPGTGRDFFNSLAHCAFLLYTCGPDAADGIVNLAPVTYDPTNGTVSYGDICYFGSGSADSATKSGNSTGQ